MTDSLVIDTQPKTPLADNDKPDQVGGADRLVPVGEAIRYRKRAQTAEQQLEDLNEEVRVMRAKLNEADETIVGLERRQKVDSLLTEADAIDLETARLLTEQAVTQMDDPEIELVVSDLKRHKPFLFRHKQSQGFSAMAPSIENHGHDPAEQAAEQATKTGDRRDLLRYLRLRRQH